jgi:hypothetical protein
MSVSNKVRMAMGLKRKKAPEMAGALGINPQSFRNKLTRDSFDACDLIAIADALGGSLVLEVEGQRVVFGMEDLVKGE